MSERIHRVIELVATSHESREKAVASAVRKAARRVARLRDPQIENLEVELERDTPTAYRARLRVTVGYRESGRRPPRGKGLPPYR